MKHIANRHLTFVKMSIIVLVLFALPVYAKNDRSIVHDKEILSLLQYADSCLDTQNKDCLDVYVEVIQLAKERKLVYIDYLYLEHALAIQRYLHQDSAMVYLNEILPEIKDEAIKDELLNGKAVIFYNKGQIDSAMQLFTIVVKSFEDREDWDNVAAVSINIASALYSQNSYDRSIEYFKKALSIFHKANVWDYDIYIYSSIGKSYLSLKDFENSAIWSKKALERPVSGQVDKKGQIEAYKTLARVYHFQNQPDSAYKYIAQGVAFANELNDNIQIANTNQILADILMKSGKDKEALNAIETSITISKGKGYKVGLLENLYTAGRISRNVGLYKKSADYYFEAKTMQDEIKTDKSIKIINELTTQYETEKKERRIAEAELEIQRKNVQIRSWLMAGIIIIGSLAGYFVQMRRNQKNRLRILEKEKENEVLLARVQGEEIERGRISKELHDGVASSLLATRLQLEKSNAEVKPKIMSMLNEIHKEVRNISHKLIPIDFGLKNWLEEVQAYCDNLNTARTQVHFFSNMKVFRVDSTQALVLFRAVQELLQNAVKHADAQNISIQIIAETHTLTISIEDDGKGALQTTIENADSLNNLKARLVSIGAVLTIESQPESGTVAFISYRNPKLFFELIANRL